MDFKYMEAPPTTTNKILCCECGTPIEPNPANTCVACLRTRIDITEAIPKQITLQFCNGCERYLNPPNEWVHCVLESRELLALCLKKLKGLNTVKLVNANFVWTEPHSKRIKVKLTVHGEVAAGAILEQVFIVEYVVNNFMCEDCHRSEAQNFWRATVQVRQRCENKKTFYFLEQLILKHKAQENTLSIKPINEGIDFFYATSAHAKKMVDFINSMLPIKYQHSKKLISHDIRSNIYNHKFTYCVDIVPVSKDSLVCLPKKLTHKLGGISPLCLVSKVTSAIHLIDPSRVQIAEVSSQVYWSNAFHSICNPKQLVEYIVINIEPILQKDRKTFPGQGALSNRHILADVWVIKASELGINDDPTHTRSHLGHILKIGDSVLGYNIQDSNINDSNFDQLDKDFVSDVILVKKHYDRSRRRKQRIWKLKHLVEEEGAIIDSKDYDEFLDDLEEDPEMRQNVKIYKDRNKPAIPIDSNDTMADDFFPQVTLEEMLDDLAIEDVEMKENVE